jgi:hypothetical protein
MIALCVTRSDVPKHEPMYPPIFSWSHELIGGHVEREQSGDDQKESGSSYDKVNTFKGDRWPFGLVSALRGLVGGL